MENGETGRKGAGARWPRFRRLLEIEAFALLIICFLGALLFDFRTAEKRERVHAIMCAENQLRAASGEFAAYLFSAQGAAAYSATILRAAIEHGEDDENLTMTVEGLTKTLQMTEKVKYKNVFAGRRGWIINSIGWKPPKDFDPSQRIWYRMAIVCPGRSIITPPYVSVEDGRVELTVARALGDAAGTVLGIDIEMSSLKSFVKDVHVLGARCGMLVAPNGYVLGCQAASHKDKLEEGPRRRRIVKRVLEEQGSFILDEDGAKTLVVSTPINAGWRAVLLVDMATLNAAVRGAYLRTLAIIGVILLTAFFFGWLAFVLVHRERVAVLKERQSREAREKELRASLEIQRAKAAERAKSAFLATMSHEIRTPLNAVIGFTEFLKDPELPATERMNCLDGITKSSNALLALINDVLDLSKIEAGKIDMRGGVSDLVALFAEMTSIFKFRAQSKQLVFRAEIADDFPVVALQEERLRQVLLNLIGNAMKFTARGSVSVSARLEEHMLSIRVADTGIGIAPSKLQEIFDPFAQDGSVRGGKVYEGTGLGLPICKRLVESVGGRITVESEVGKGSCFTVEIPDVKTLARPVVASKGSDGESAPAHQSWDHVVLVDDVNLNLMIAAKYVELAGVPKDRIRSFSHAGEALAHLMAWRQANPSGAVIVFTDMWMPEMSGEAFVREVRGRPHLKTIPVVAMTADADSAVSFDMSPFDRILTKPMTGEKIRLALDEIPFVSTRV